MKGENIGIKMESLSKYSALDGEISQNSNLIENTLSKEINFNVLQVNLSNCLNMIDDEVMKGYITRLDHMPIIEADLDDMRFKDIHFFKISELVYQENEFSVDKLAMVFNVLSNQPCTLVLMLRSDGKKTNFYLGSRPNDDRASDTLFQMLKQSLIGFFPGSKIDKYFDEQLKEDMLSIKAGAISNVTCVADYKQDQSSFDNKNFLQGLEKFVYSMQGKAYTGILIAENVGNEYLVNLKNEYERIYTQISPFANMQMSFSFSDGGSTSKGSSEGITASRSQTDTVGSSITSTETVGLTSGISRSYGATENHTFGHSASESDGKTHTEGTTKTENTTITDGTSNSVHFGSSRGVNFGIPGGVSFSSGSNYGVSHTKSHSVSKGTSHSDSISDSVSKTLTHGINDSHGVSKSTTYGISESESISESMANGLSESRSETLGETYNYVDTKTLTETFGTSKGVTLNVKNKMLESILDKLEKHLERIDECESFGMWNFAAYFIGETMAETETAANTYKAVIAGIDSGIERSAVNTWNDEDSIRKLMKYLDNFHHPEFLYKAFSYDEDRDVFVNPGVLVSTKELALHMGLPRHSVMGLPVVEHAVFGKEAVVNGDKGDSYVGINLGKVYDLGKLIDTRVELDINSLDKHTFITGSTGSGKSNTVFHLLNKLRKKGIPFLVVEPAKGEYRQMFKDITCFGTNPNDGLMLKINPFSFPENVHVLEHIDRLLEIFNVCWPMYAAMPAVLKESVEKAYRNAGWDIRRSANTISNKLFPTFEDVLRELNDTIKESEYSNDTKGDYIGSLSTRLKSLTNGINGEIFTGDEVNLEDLFDKSAIVDISRIGAMDTKALIMGIIVLKLREYRSLIADDNGYENKNNEEEYLEKPKISIKHITVLEEAHNILKKTSTEQSQDSANIAGKSVEMLTNTIAEIRAYGEGFVIVDQAPNLLDTAVIRNTNTKIILRLPEENDREITGKAMGLSDEQIKELSKLETGVAAVYQNNWQEAVLCKIPKANSLYVTYKKEPEGKIVENINDRILHLLLRKDLTQVEKSKLKEDILKLNLSAKIRKDLVLNLDNRNAYFEWAMADFINKIYQIDNAFYGTSTSRWNSFDSLEEIAINNIKSEFSNFDGFELHKILYYICMAIHEKSPENEYIKLLLNNYRSEVL